MDTNSLMSFLESNENDFLLNSEYDVQNHDSNNTLSTFQNTHTNGRRNTNGTSNINRKNSTFHSLEFKITNF